MSYSIVIIIISGFSLILTESKSMCRNPSAGELSSILFFILVFRKGWTVIC